MSYRVLIPTAGIGSRLGNLTQFLNKSLVSVANRPILSHIIDLFPNDTEFVIALGHKGDLIREFVQLAYPERQFFFAEVNPFEGTGSGLGLSILSCKQYLQQPFIFISCDTLVRGDIPAPDHNWMGYAEIEDLDEYRTIQVEDAQVKAICEKGIGNVGAHMPYIGLAGVRDYELFWNAIEHGASDAIAIGEAYGLRSLIARGISAQCFEWYDTGNLSALASTRESYRQKNEPNILEKPNEAIWFVNENIIKFSDDKEFVTNRVKRAKIIRDFVPVITGSTKHMYRYKKVIGDTLSSVVNIPIFKQLLQHSQMFWSQQKLTLSEKNDFNTSCVRFYKDKTLERIDLFYKKFGKHDGTEKINGLVVPALEKLLEMIDWNWLTDGLSGRFHGDFHFENILFSQEEQKFIFLDWRQEFGNSLTTGDVYYDLAKLLHGMIVCHQLIAENRYSIVWTDSEIVFDFERKQSLVECEQYFYRWLVENEYDLRKVWLLTGLVYLNIAALHHHPYCLLLFALGKQIIFNETGGENGFA